jgi:predicted DNA-binding protein (UPF0251 family)
MKPILDMHQQFRVWQLCYIDHHKQGRVARLYGVSQGTISNILRRLKEERAKIGEEAFKQKALDNGVDISEE